MPNLLMLLVILAATASSAHVRGFNRCLHTPYRGITVTSELGEILGPVDADDWGCLGSIGRGGVGRMAEEGPVPPPPTAVCLKEAFPNPATSATNLQIALPASSSLTLTVYGRRGETGGRVQLVKTLLDGPFAAGTHQVRWDLTDEAGARVAPGIYRVLLEAGDQAICGDVQVQ